MPFALDVCGFDRAPIGAICYFNPDKTSVVGTVLIVPPSGPSAITFVLVDARENEF